MERYVDVMKQAVELVKTMQEGIAHIQTQLNEGQFEQSIVLFQDVMTAYAALQRSVTPVLTELKEDEVTPQFEKLAQPLELVVSGYEQKEYGRVKEVIQFTLLPYLQKMEQSLSEAFAPYIVS
ncbi:hypothetical protein [Halalkalibacter nanhaiisediminis]|uniref:DUF8042 domain-containing protein n=1 Tax=Halalkalibacter nanhaiisediminis TaxID=688079 RepID=A0A562QT65_9BACI|nr:hypothetical protein [Halalkalibacter nanhaiisediminis]TWI59958.1 hypothetical protein IQ10_00381 [Halalkalibacter nanhaiisediminis]